MVIIGVDPGYSGALCIINGKVEVYEMPIKTIKDKTSYDVMALVNLLNKYKKDNPIVAIENVHTMPHQGAVSGGKLLEGKGILIGAATAIFNVDPILVSPQSWKKIFPELTQTPDLIALKTQVDLSMPNAKMRANAKYKTAVKSNTRLCAIKRYPYLADQLARVKDDGKADALFIALYVKESRATKAEETF